MPKINRPPKTIDTNAFLTNWLTPYLVIPETTRTFKPSDHTDQGRVLKILSVERRAQKDGLYRVQNGLKVIVCDANVKVFAVLTPDAICQYENTERCRVTKSLINSEILVYDLGVKFIEESDALRDYGFRVTGDREHEGELRRYATIYIERFELFSRDRCMPRDEGMIPFLYGCIKYRNRYFLEYLGETYDDLNSV
ncbi:hypothetical protein FOA43_002866 [Brettanomyces nanus]|uniref:Telomere replication protein EST3 n=1 Tax=Eeniella nana TaxID=13502 RepID=A0A875S196_EENNA|nr:uncharacterized protein FOA43_002866 [Brettanomyces nanus]QPG75511.1 hypothetical protein FOA43_002866 [Brettanomyces nanus]